MRKLQQIQINGKNLPEAFILMKWFNTRFAANKNVLLSIVGGTGSGKSYATLRIVQLWYKFKFKQKYPIENICFSIKEAMLRIQKGNLPKGSIIIIEEAGCLLNSLEFQNRIQRFFGWVLQSFRCKNIGIIFNLPSLNMLNKTARILLHAIFLTESVNIKTKESLLKLFFMRVDYITGEQQPTYFRHVHNNHLVKVKKMKLYCPTQEIIEPYEIKKNNFVDETGSKLIAEIEKEELEKELKELTPLQKAAIKALKKNDLSTFKDIELEKGDENIKLGKDENGEIKVMDKELIGTIQKPIRDENGKIVAYEEMPVYRNKN